MSDPRAGSQLSLFGAASAHPLPEPRADPDTDARAFAVDPRENVVLEASAGTGKTSVLVARYVNLLRSGADPSNILAITFTRKAAAEMRERILRDLRTSAERSEGDRRRWMALRDRVGEIAISTIDAFCLSMLREFPLEGDIDPAFELADETDVPRLVATALDRAMRVLAGRARHEADLALVLAQLGIARTREGLAMLLERRLVARGTLDRFLARGPQELTPARVCREALDAVRDLLDGMPGGSGPFLADGPAAHPRYALLVREINRLEGLREAPDAAVRAALERVASHFLTAEGTARRPGTAVPPYKPEHYPSRAAAKQHREALFALAPRVEAVMRAFNRDLNVILARGIRKMFALASSEYRSTLDERSLLDFSDVLERALELLRRMDEFSQSRYRLESRYHHVLVDEFQDTSRAQWELVALLVQAWGQGQGLAASPSIFIVGDRKQSIYRFRDADVAVLQEAADYIESLRPGSRPRRSITRSFRAVPELLHLVNDVFLELSQPARTADGFTYDERDRFPVEVEEIDGRADKGEPALGIAAAATPEECAQAVAGEIVRLLSAATVRDKATGIRRPVRPGDIAILFRSRSSHREFERELGSRGVPTHVHKGLGFFDADEIKDLTSLIRYLADPASQLRAAALLRSRIIRLSDAGLAALAPDLAGALAGHPEPPALAVLDEEDRRVLLHARAEVPQWLDMADRVPPAELLDYILDRTSYAYELRGARRRQAWENVKKFRGLVRRIQNRGYATVPRIAAHLASISASDESNAAVEALDAVSLMTVHASKGLEFPVVFVVNLAKGAAGPAQPVRVIPGSDRDGEPGPSVSVGPFLSESDELEKARERHETCRLLYVALTRARDRLYLSSVLKDASFAAGRGSLGEVLPASLTNLFENAFSAFPQLDALGWTGVSGHEYTWRICRAGTAAAAESRPDEGGGRPLPPAVQDDVAAPAVPVGAQRLAAAELIASVDTGPRPIEEARSDRLLGLLVHRLLEAVGPPTGRLDERDARSALERLIRMDVRVMADDDDVERLVDRAAAVWLGLAERAELQALEGIERAFEVPFSLLLADLPAPIVVRGVIDCLVRKQDGRLVVVEFKTGRRESAHERQLELYVRAARALAPGSPVEGVLVYV